MEKRGRYSADEIYRIPSENLFHNKVFSHTEGVSAGSERLLPGLEEAEDRRPVDYHVFAGMPFEKFLFVSGIELQFYSESVFLTVGFLRGVDRPKLFAQNQPDGIIVQAANTVKSRLSYSPFFA